MSARVIKHSLVIAGHRTSISLEDAFWSALKDCAQERAISLAALVTEIDSSRGDANLSSAIRVYLFNHAKRETGSKEA
jgi:predicted DNA-binding ribbon-helix-helix protein